jgi:hypothetical protein
MIAIGILGIGMLMVAATFPVGIEQTRIATQETMIPMVVDDAVGTMKLLLAENRARVRFPSGAMSTLRAAIEATAGASAMDGTLFSDFLWTSPAPDKVHQLAAAPQTLNGWLGAVRDYPSTGAQPGSGNRAGTTGSYTWLALFRPLPPFPQRPAQVEVVFLVLRRSSALPELVKVEGSMADLTRVSIHGAVDTTSGTAPSLSKIMSDLGPGLALVRVDSTGNVVVSRIATVDAPRTTVYLDAVPSAQAVIAEGVETNVWLIPKDSASGVSPVIGWQRRILSLD